VNLFHNEYPHPHSSDRCCLVSVAALAVTPRYPWRHRARPRRHRPGAYQCPKRFTSGGVPEYGRVGGGSWQVAGIVNAGEPSIRMVYHETVPGAQALAMQTYYAFVLIRPARLSAFGAGQTRPSAPLPERNYLMNGIEAILLLALIVFVYMLPTVVSTLRHKANTLLIGVLNVLFGWTIIGWFFLPLHSLSTETVDQLKNGVAVRSIS
jgi:hypothetical protein